MKGRTATLDTIEAALAAIDGGLVLDVATQEGRFARVLMDNLRSYTGIVGIDISERAIEAARTAIESESVSFSVMDAGELEFEDESFDTVCVSASLHHFEEIGRVLEEMKRVLRRRGRFIVAEMYRDAPTEPELTSVLLHQWAAEIDSALGRTHNRQLERREIMDHFAALGLRRVESRDCLDRDSDPMEASKIKQLEDVIARVGERAAETSEAAAFRKRAGRLVDRLREVGAVGEPMLLVTGEK